jgi:hypothetical protein
MTQEGYHCSLIAGVISGCGGDELVSAFSVVECPQLQPDTWCSHELDLQVADRWRALSLIIRSQQSLGDALDNDHPHRAEEETMEEVALPCCSPREAEEMDLSLLSVQTQGQPWSSEGMSWAEHEGRRGKRS